MAAQDWFATNWIQPNWYGADWWAAPGGGISRTAQIGVTQEDQGAGGSRWLSPNWLTPQWAAPDWFARYGWVAAAGGAVQQISSSFSIPALGLWPSWVAGMQSGFPAQFVPTQQGDSMALRAVFLLPAADRVALLTSQQADQVANIRMTQTLNPLTRIGQIAAVQEGDSMSVEVAFAYSGGSGPRRYGRRKKPYPPYPTFFP